MAISQYGNEYYGLSGDDKPLGTPLNGRKFTEMDTSKEYRYDAENQQWLEQSGGGGGGSTALSGLTDVDISNPTNGQVLVYNAETGKWENGAGGGGGGGALVVRGETVGEDVILDHTYAEIITAAPLVYYGVEPAAGRTVFLQLQAFGTIDELYVVQFGNDDLFSTDSEDGYPVERGFN